MSSSSMQIQGVVCVSSSDHGNSIDLSVSTTFVCVDMRLLFFSAKTTSKASSSINM